MPQFRDTSWPVLSRFYFKPFILVLVCDCGRPIHLDQHAFLYDTASVPDPGANVKLTDSSGVTEFTCQCGAKYHLGVKVCRYE